MPDNKSNGRKPGHNASSKGFVSTPPVKPVAPGNGAPAGTHSQLYGRVCKPTQSHWWNRVGKTNICPCGKAYVLEDITDDLDIPGRVVRWVEVTE